MVGVHLEDTTDTLFLARTRVVNIRTGLQLTRIHAEIAQTTYIRVGGNLECQSCERLVYVCMTYYGRVLIARVITVNLRNIQR